MSVFHCQHQIANRVLEKLFKVPDFSASEDEKLILELIWQSFSGRPKNTPWAAWDNTQLIEATKKFDPRVAMFYESWTRVDWIEKMLGVTIGPDYDAHQWKDSQDPWAHAISARVLCQPMEGKLPNRESLEEAFAAVDKLFTQLPLRGENMPHSHIFSPKIYFILASHLGHSAKALEILQISGQRNGSELHTLVEVPVTYEILAESNADPPIDILSLAQLEEISNVLCMAIDTRVEHGWRKPLHDLSAAELLSRFTNAAFFVHRDEYVKNDIHKPEDILYMPITAERIAEIETELGPLPTDVKEIALIGDGFCGGWHFAGGGWPGIENLETTSAADYEVYLDIEPEPQRRVETRTRPDGITYEVVVMFREYGGNNSRYVDRGDVLVGRPDMECDLFEHVLCPPSVWAKYQAIKGIQVKDGDYAYLYYATWTAGGKIYSSVREWIASMTIELERKVAVGERTLLKDEA